MQDNDLISRQAALDALWKALYKYEDETEKQFQASEDLDVGDWIEHRIFVQNMNDIDRQTILNLPSAQSNISNTLESLDCIDRQAAIEVADAIWSVTGDKNVARVWDQIKDLPSAQPEIIRCKDCKWCEDTDGLMCKNTASWVVATDYDFGCILAERRQEQ